MPDSNIFVVVRHRIGGQDYGRCRWIAPGLTGRETARGLRGQWSVRPIHIPAPSVHSAPRIILYALAHSPVADAPHVAPK